MPATVPENSTNVRFSPPPARRKRRRPLPLAIRAARAGFRVLGPYAPSLASGYAEHLFLSARRHPRPAWERAALASGEPFAIPDRGRLLPAWRWGNGPRTVLLVHGWEGRGSQLAAFVEPLVQRGFSVVTFDVPGHGDAPPGHASVVDHARAVASVARHLGPLHAVIGHSVGGAASLFATRLGLRAERMVLVSPPVSPQRFATGFGEMLGLDDEVLHGLLSRLEHRYGIRMEDLDVRSDAAGFRGPLLVVHDAGDRVVPFVDGQAIADAARGSRLVTTHGLGHQRVLRAPEVLEAVIPFVAAGAPPAEHVATLAEALDADLFYRERRW